VTDIIAILLRSAFAFLLAVVGGAVSAHVGISHRRLCGLISLAAGTLLGVTVFSILPESLEAMRWWELLISAGSGYIVFLLLSRYVFHVCPACAASHFDETTTHRFSEIATALVIALGIHSTMDGVALTAGHETHAGTGPLDLSVLIAICVHKMPEGLALGALLLGAGFARVRVIAWVAVVESTTLLGSALGLWGLRHVSEWWMLAVLAHAGGGFIYLAAHAVFGELLEHGKAIVLGGFIGGILLIGGLNLLMRFL
jgi:zinc transporter ZupT